MTGDGGAFADVKTHQAVTRRIWFDLGPAGGGGGRGRRGRQQDAGDVAVAGAYGMRKKLRP